jgi:hypothetical protein
MGVIDAIFKAGDPLAPGSEQYTHRQLENRLPVPTALTDLLDVVRQENSRRYEAIRIDITTRLRHACCYMSDEEFAALVEKMVKTQFKGERHGS